MTTSHHNIIGLSQMESVAKEVDAKLKKFTNELMQDLGATVDDAVVKYISENYDRLVTVDGVYDYSKYNVQLPTDIPIESELKFIKGEKVVYLIKYPCDDNCSTVLLFTNNARFVIYRRGQRHCHPCYIVRENQYHNYWIPPILIDLFIVQLDTYSKIYVPGQDFRVHNFQYRVDQSEGTWLAPVSLGSINDIIKTLAKHSSEYADEFHEKIRGLAVVDAAVLRYTKKQLTRAVLVETFEAAEREREELAAARQQLAQERAELESKKQRLILQSQQLALQKAELDAKLKILDSVKYESI